VLGHRRRGLFYAPTFPLAVPILLSLFEAVRFVWVDRAEFESRFVTTERA
jgi:hypothetical protein